MEEKKQENSEKAKEKIVQKLIEEEMKSSYLDYSMSVIVGRALPDVRDGLKPVHRRILYAMHQMGMFHNKPFKKSARIVGEVLGKFHPHGDVAVYDSLVRLVQPFSMRYPLIRGQGNFGSIDGDRAAAMRYTEAKLSKLSEEILKDIEKKTVKFVPNFDGSLKEPFFLPAKLPNLLINGSSGIAVGMATNIPPHNLNEVADAAINLIDNPESNIGELMQFIKGPDFPTAGIISGKKGIREAYTTGKGRVFVKAKYNIEEGKLSKRIIVTEIPYMVNKSQLLEEIANLVTDKKIRGISDLRDESDRKGMRVVIFLRKDANPDVVVNQLFKHTRLKVTFGIINLALVDGQPKILNLKELLQNYVDHRRSIVRKRTKFDLNKAEDRAHILEGLLVALGDIDNTVKMIKESNSADEAKTTLVSKLEITEKQALAILDMKLQRLTGLEQDKIKNEHKELLGLIEKLKTILADENKILQIIKDELQELKKNYGDERRTEIIEEEEEEIVPEDLIKSENMVVTITHSGYIKRLP
ncbi:DNA topoisomerase 4 subunit A, partial [Candidatus Woesearchaeota archaeon]|nr:DNA topoisomerase 4 subunit A [Candidatus Woesearchaeota archaeon]